MGWTGATEGAGEVEEEDGGTDRELDRTRECWGRWEVFLEEAEDWEPFDSLDLRVEGISGSEESTTARGLPRLPRLVPGGSSVGTVEEDVLVIARIPS